LGDSACASRAPAGRIVSELLHLSPEIHFDLLSLAYPGIVFFHRFVRRAFFDTANTSRDHEALMHRYVIQYEPRGRLLYAAEHIRGTCASVEVTDLRLLLFANGISILMLAIEARETLNAQALWINEMLRKIYPSSDRQIETARVPSRLALVEERNGQRHTIAEERWEKCRITGFSSATEFPLGYENGEDYDVAFGRFLYVDRYGSGFRYEPDFIRQKMKKQIIVKFVISLIEN
jgi:hypothetical protein